MSQFRRSSTEDVDNNFDDKFAHNRENVSELRSDGVLRRHGFTKVDGSTALFRRIGVVGLLQEENLKSDDFLCKKKFSS